MNEVELEELVGAVESVIYHNDETGFTVLEIDSGGVLVTAVCEADEINEGEELHLMGNYVTHPSYGSQFKAVSCETKMPATAVAIEKYLASGAIKGIGPKTAVKIVDLYGDKALEVIENEPERLCEIKGISKNKCKQISDDFKRLFGIRSTINFLKVYNVTAIQSIHAWKTYGVATVEVVKENPFALCSESIGVPFEVADQIAESFDIPKDYDGRIIAGLLTIMYRSVSYGHTCIENRRLIELTQQLTDISCDDISNILYELSQKESVVFAEINGVTYVYLPQYYYAETYIAERLSVIINTMPDIDKNWDKEINKIEKKNGFAYEHLQRKAISMALSNGITVLTGGPGTGKTTTIKGIIDLYISQGHKVMLAAPTGRAAKRLSELTGHEAKTIHRMLEVEYSNSEIPSFRRNSKNPLDCDVVVIDEISMVDLLLFEALLSALKLSCRIVLVGDSDQLPPVGAGNILGDMLDSDCVPTVVLSEIFRQAAQSLIVTNAHSIINGELPNIETKDNDFFMLRTTSAPQSINLIQSLVSQRLPKAYGYSIFEDMQVVCPSRIGDMGTVTLNIKLQQTVNPYSKDKPELRSGQYTFRKGDKVMQIKNNYDVTWERDDGDYGAGIFNGDLGIIEDIETDSRSVIVRYDDKVVKYAFEQLNELELAYAVTVHKSQGSEFEAVILALSRPSRNLYYRNLLYTAVTRAKKLLIIVGSEEALAYMVNNNRKNYRCTNLKAYIEKEILGEYQ